MILSKEEIILFTAFVAGAFENRLFVINKFHINTSRRTRTRLLEEHSARLNGKCQQEINATFTCDYDER